VGVVVAAHDLVQPKKELDRRVAEVLGWIDLEPAVANMHPPELSGEMKQRVCIAIALSLRA
jgi:ABC-type dipeptide/oligopeptide/nickel transport system ATPase component